MKMQQVPSPNFNDRAHTVDMLVLHYTGMETGQAALDRMIDPEAAVSAHYMLWEDGRIAQLVAEEKRAWHAGVSSWQGDGDLNSRSIGIEIVNGGHDWPMAGGGLAPYPRVQIEALIALCQGIQSRWDIPAARIVGHSDIAPARKDDPGEHFPWDKLSRAGIGLWPALPPSAETLGLIGRGLGATDAGEAVSRLQTSLAGIGYGLMETGTYDTDTEAVVRAFQRRWLQDEVTGQASLNTLRMIDLVHALYQDAG